MAGISETISLVDGSSAVMIRIANKVGYDNLGFFYKKFEAIYKMTPQKYRELKYDSLL